LIINLDFSRVNRPGKLLPWLIYAIAELTGFKPAKIAEELGMSYQWVMKYLSEKYKREYQSLQRGDLPNCDFHPATELNQSESTMTEEEEAGFTF